MKQILAVALLLSACSSVLGSERIRAPAEIAGYNDGDPQVVVNVQGGAVNVSVVSYGNGCYSKGETEVRVSGRTVNVHPYDYRDRGVCTDILLSFLHEATVVVGSPGPVTIRIHGQDRRGHAGPPGVTANLVVERTVLIP
jgi:hypothetical protein